MSVAASNELKTQEPLNASKSHSIRCRIPQRLPVDKSKSPIPNNSVRTKKIPEPASRPKSANRIKDEVNSGRVIRQNTRAIRLPPPCPPTNLKRPPLISRRLRDSSGHGKGGRPLIMVPVMQVPNCKSMDNNAGLPDQETIAKYEDLERQTAISEFNGHPQDDPFLHSSKSEQLIQLKVIWQEKNMKFEDMKNELRKHQKEILELYSVMRDIHLKMNILGEETKLDEDLKVMNVAKLSPDKLLQLCSEQQNFGDGLRYDVSQIPVDINKVYKMPAKLVDTCEQTLQKRKEIIDWFESLKTIDKGVSLKVLTKKIDEFNAENDMMKSTLEQVKTEFLSELEELIQIMKKGTVETMGLQMRAEELTYKLSELNSENSDLRKQINNLEHLRSQTTKSRFEELEKELKEERCKKIFLKERLARAEGQVKINVERASQLDAALEQAKLQTLSLETAVQQLHEQNVKLQHDFDKELNKLNESIREHTLHLETIAKDREKIQVEKDELEKRLLELSDYYEEILGNVKNDLTNNIKKLIETEKLLAQEKEEKTKIVLKVESLNQKLMEADTKLKANIQEIADKNNKLGTMMQLQKDMEITSNQLKEAHSEVEEYKNRLVDQNKTLMEMEKKYDESLQVQQSLLEDLNKKTEYISELEKKQYITEEQLQENEIKMEDYVQQLSTLKIHIAKLQKDFGEFENLNELRDIVNEQRTQLQEVTQEKRELSVALQKKEDEMEKLTQNLTQQEQLIEEHENTIKLLSDKDEENTNIIQMLQTDLEMKTEADSDLNQRLIEKETEIETLLTNLETRKQQISNLEEIILTLENQNKMAAIQTKKDQDIITMLQNKISEYEEYSMDFMGNDIPAENFDNIIKRIEEELRTPLESHVNEDVSSRMQCTGNRKRNDHQHISHNAACNTHLPVPTKIVTGNFIKKTYTPCNNTAKYQGDGYINRRQGITRNKELDWDVPESDGQRYYLNKKNNPDDSFLNSKTSNFSKNFKTLPITEHRDERKFKLLKKLAGHKL